MAPPDLLFLFILSSHSRGAALYVYPGFKGAWWMFDPRAMSVVVIWTRLSARLAYAGNPTNLPLPHPPCLKKRYSRNIRLLRFPRSIMTTSANPQRYASAITFRSLPASSSILLMRAYNPLTSLFHLPPPGKTAFRSVFLILLRPDGAFMRNPMRPRALCATHEFGSRSLASNHLAQADLFASVYFLLASGRRR